MVMGLRFFHTLGIVGLFQDCEQGGGEDPGPWRGLLSVLLLNVARLRLLQSSEQLAALSSFSGQRLGICLYYTHAVPKRFILLVLPQGWFPRDWCKQPGAAGWGASCRPAAGPRRIRRTCRVGSSLLGAIHASATLTVPQAQLGQSWKKPTMECEVEYGW